ncbi:hypothetical protein KI387_029984, partial [Taxus chinensis]
GLDNGSAIKAAVVVGIKDLTVEDVPTEVVDEEVVEEEVVVVVDVLIGIRTSLDQYNILQVLKDEGPNGM